MKQIEVVAAIIFDEQGRIFATQRGYGEWKDWWEFPGGKMESGETPQQALKREIREELDIRKSRHTLGTRGGQMAQNQRLRLGEVVTRRRRDN